jgi:hypothetical protein
MGDPEKRLAIVRERYEEGTKYEKESGRQDASRGAFERIFTAEVIRIITVLRETGDKAGAKKIQAEALKTVSNDAIRNALK